MKCCDAIERVFGSLADDRGPGHLLVSNSFLSLEVMYKDCTRWFKSSYSFLWLKRNSRIFLVCFV